MRYSRTKLSLSLAKVLNVTSASKATNSHDKIFAVFPLAKDGLAIVPEIDYSKPIDDIFRELMIRMLTTNKEKRSGVRMNLICLDSPRSPRRLDLPSWVVDWSAIWRCHYRGSDYSSATQRVLREYCACGVQPAKVRFSDHDTTMVTSGYNLDTIQTLSDASKYVKTDSSSANPLSPPELPKTNSFGIYGNEMSVYNAIWRSLIYDRIVSSIRIRRGIEAPAIFGHHFREYFNLKSPYFSKLSITEKYHLNELIGPFHVFGRPIEEWSRIALKEQINTEQPINSNPEEFIRHFVLKHMERRFMVTGKGYVGVTHAQSQVGDSIVLLKGCTMPMILRRCEGGWRVVGEAYVHGIMQGEAWREKEGEEMETIRLK